MSPRQETITLLKKNGFRLSREGGDHTVFFNEATRKTLTVPRHNFDESMQRIILKEAGIKK